MMHWLNHVLFNFGSDGVTPAEILGFVTGIACVALVVKQRVMNFPIGIANSAFFLILFWHAHLFADSSLQIIFLVAQVFGWWAWLRAGPNSTPLSVTDTSLLPITITAAGVACGTAILYPILKDAHDIAPFWDAFTTSLSLGAQLLLNYKKIGNWYFWIVADIIYIPLYFFKDLYLTGIVYVVFLALASIGLRQWQAARVDCGLEVATA